MYEWTREETKERFPDQVSPLGWSVLQSALDVNLESIKNEFYLKKLEKSDVTRWINGFLYSQKNFFKRIPLSHFRRLSILALLVRLFIYSITTLFDFNRRNNFKGRLFERIYKKELHTKIQLVVKNWRLELPKHISEFESNRQQSFVWNANDLNFQNLLKKIEADGCAYNRLDFAIYFYKNILKYMLESLNKAESSSKIEALTKKSPFLIGRHIQSVAAESDFSTQTVKEKLGHLSLSWDIAQPTFSEQADLLIALSQIMDLKLDSPNSISIDFPASEIEKNFVELVACDEEHRFYASYQFPYIRSIFLKIAEAWNGKQFLANTNDIYFLTLDEILQFHNQFLNSNDVDPKSIYRLINQRKSYLIGEPRDALSTSQLNHVEELFYLSRLQEIKFSFDSSQAHWKGIPGSPGRVKGQVFWVTNYESLLKCPDRRIVLCQTPSPNFHSSFVKSIGIASETGGLLSHGAILARELNIPCLMQVHNLKNLKNDDWIELDATQGTLKRLP